MPRVDAVYKFKGELYRCTHNHYGHGVARYVMLDGDLNPLPRLNHHGVQERNADGTMGLVTRVSIAIAKEGVRIK